MAMRTGAVTPPIIAIGTSDGSAMTVVEGASRLTAYAMLGFPSEQEIIYGIAALEVLRGWRWWCPAI